jgi:hypothetical protein
MAEMAATGVDAQLGQSGDVCLPIPADRFEVDSGE